MPLIVITTATIVGTLNRQHAAVKPVKPAVVGLVRPQHPGLIPFRLSETPPPPPTAAPQPGVAAARPAAPAPRPRGPVPVGIPGNWTLKFDDEFNGTSLDASKWGIGSPYGSPTVPVNNYELECYDPALVSVHDGSLHIVAIAKQETCGGSTKQYAGGMVNTRGLYQHTYGAVEARVYSPAASAGVIANWPAFWEVGAVWPQDGENDVYEGLNARACWHFHSNAGAPGGCANGAFTGWHVYGANWHPGRVDYYYDGRLVGSITMGITSVPEWLMIDNAISPTIGGATMVPADMQVDYVRVWQ